MGSDWVISHTALFTYHFCVTKQDGGIDSLIEVSKIVICSHRKEFVVACLHNAVEVRARTDSSIPMLWLSSCANGNIDFGASAFGMYAKG